MAAVYASKGHRVIGVDINIQFVDALNRGEAPVVEKDLSTYISAHTDHIKATTNYHDAIMQSDITFIIVPTPTDDTGGFSIRYVQAACQSIGEVLKEKNAFHLVVLTSTLLPGDCQRFLIPILEEKSGKVCGRDFGFCYSPEFIAIGSVIYDLLHPDFFLVGEGDMRSGDMLQAFYRTICDESVPVRRMTISSAELTKISVNSFLTMKITYANMLTEIAEHIPGVDIDSVTTAIGSDKRISPHYLRGGLGYGGPCFPRDNRAFATMAKSYGVTVPYADRTDEYNLSIIDRAVRLIKERIPLDVSIGFWSISYKPGTYFSEESQALEIARQLSLLGYAVHIYHPEGNQHAQALLHDTSIVFHSDMEGMSGVVQAVFFSNMDRQVVSLVQALPKQVRYIIDPWRQCDPAIIPTHIQYIRFGIFV